MCYTNIFGIIDDQEMMFPSEPNYTIVSRALYRCVSVIKWGYIPQLLFLRRHWLDPSFVKPVSLKSRRSSL